MELFLNLCWFLLVFSALVGWRCGAGFAPFCRLQPSRIVLVLASALLLLFPVISATDDLHVMRADVEESSNGKRSVADSGKDQTGTAHSTVYATASRGPSSAKPEYHVCGCIIADGDRGPLSRFLTARSSRAPPAFLSV
jgi:hypothetical protein